MGIFHSEPMKPYYDIQPKDIVFPEDFDDGSDSDDMPHECDTYQGHRYRPQGRLHAQADTMLW